jgi:hypothetical protein
MAMEFHYVLASKRVWRLEIANESAVKNRTRFRIEEISEPEEMRLRVKGRIGCQRLKDAKRVRPTQSDHANGATTRRSADSNDGINLSTHKRLNRRPKNARKYHRLAVDFGRTRSLRAFPSPIDSVSISCSSARAR